MVDGAGGGSLVALKTLMEMNENGLGRCVMEVWNAESCGDFKALGSSGAVVPGCGLSEVIRHSST